MKKWVLAIFLCVAFGFSCLVFFLAERPEPIEVLPDTFEAEVNYALPDEHLLSVRVLDQRYTGHLMINTENLELPRLCGGFCVKITLDPAAPHPSETSLLSIQVSDLEVLNPPPGIAELTEQHLEGFVVHKEGREITLLVGDKTYRVLPGNDPIIFPGDRISVSYYPGHSPDYLEFVTEVKRLERARDMDWGIQLEVLEITRYQCKLRIHKESDFPFPLTVDDQISVYLPIPAEKLPHSLSCVPLETEAEAESYTLSGDDVFVIDFEKDLMIPLKWSGIYKFEKTVYYGNIENSYTVSVPFSIPGANLGEGNPWPG